MKRILFGLAALTLIVAATSCDKVKQPNVAVADICEVCDTITDFPTNTNTKRNIILEEFTGHLCANCPGGTYLAQQMDSTYGEQFVIVAMHPESSFTVLDPDGDGKYTTNWVIEEASEILTFFVPSPAYPSGMISRKEIAGNYSISKNQWPAEVMAIENDAPLFNIQSIAKFYESQRALCVNTEVEALTAVNGTYKVIHYLVEDSIVDWQKNGNPVLGQGHWHYPIGSVADYAHRHVLRDVFGHVGVNEGEPLGSGSIWGDEIINGSAATGDKFHLLTSLCDVNDSWDEHHFYIVSFVYDDATKEILQVYEGHVEVEN